MGGQVMTAVGEASQGVPDGLVGDHANSIRGHHQPSCSTSRHSRHHSNIGRLIWSGAFAVVLAVVVAHSTRFEQSDLLATEQAPERSYTLTSTGLAGFWLTALAHFRTRSRRIIGAGHSRSTRTKSSATRLFGSLAIAALLVRLKLASGYLAIAQFTKVIRGEVSVAGSRPPLRRDGEAYNGRIKRRPLVRPGVTGLAAAGALGSVVYAELVDGGDVLRIGKTVKAVPASEGVY